MSTTQSLDAGKQAAFEEKLVSMLNLGSLAVMVSIGHRTGLFDTMAGAGPLSSVEIADRAGLNERYVREWLGAVVTGQILEHDHATGTYWLPAEHAALVTRAATPNNLAVFAQYIPMMGTVEDDVIDCFKNGGGVPYSRYTRFHEVMAEDSGQTVLPVIESHILPLVDGLVDRLDQGIHVLDVGCGRGKAMNQLAKRFPNSTFVGVDLSADAVAFATAEAEKAGLANVSFVQGDATHLADLIEPGSFQLVTTFDAVHDQAAPRKVVAAIRTALTEDGVYLAQDIQGSSCHHGDMDHPIGPLLYSLSVTHCMTVSLAQGGDGLGTMWGREQAVALFNEAGFTDVAVNELDHDIQNYYYVCRP
ncbi:MAG: class I SAM-dependent methyltransferase [Magnetospiraceae bacterium]